MLNQRELRFEAVLSGLTIGMIARPTGQLETCRADELVSRVRERASGFEQDYEQLLVRGDAGFVGLLDLKRLHRGRVDRAAGFRPLSTAHLVSADRPILDALLADDIRFDARLVVSGSGVVRLVTPQDFLKPAVGLVLVSLILELETEMTGRIQAERPGAWDSGFDEKLRTLDLWPRAWRRPHPLTELRNALFHDRFAQQYDTPDIRELAVQALDLLRAVLVRVRSEKEPYRRAFVYYLNQAPGDRSVATAHQQAIQAGDPVGEYTLGSWKMWCSAYDWQGSATLLGTYSGLGAWMVKLRPLPLRGLGPPVAADGAGEPVGGEAATEETGQRAAPRVLRLPGERELPWRGFHYYLKLPVQQRSVPRARRRAIEAGDSAAERALSTWREWSRKFNWKQRVASYDANAPATGVGRPPLRP